MLGGMQAPEADEPGGESLKWQKAPEDSSECRFFCCLLPSFRASQPPSAQAAKNSPLDSSAAH